MATFDVHTAIADPTVKAVHGGCSQDDDCQAFVYKTGEKKVEIKKCQDMCECYIHF